jgi:protein involved in polysaccharide export with SLBB domain
MPPTAQEPGGEPVPEPESPAETNPFGPENEVHSTPRSAPVEGPQRHEYVVDPPDMLLVEVLEALPGRPISGERLIRPDGCIGLGFYGEVPVAGLTLSQVKERIVLHLRKFISDEKLGLVESDPGSRAPAPRRDASGRVLVKDPRQTDRVFVDVTAYNSQNYYVLGEVAYPGRLPHTGGDTVLDVLQYAGGLLPTADKGRIRLIRSFPKGSPARVLPVDYNEIAMGTDSSTNYPILPNDRLVIPAASASSREAGPFGLTEPVPEPSEPGRDQSVARRMKSDPGAESTGYFNRLTSRPARDPNAGLERRIEELAFNQA